MGFFMTTAPDALDIALDLRTNIGTFLVSMSEIRVLFSELRRVTSRSENGYANFPWSSARPSVKT